MYEDNATAGVISELRAGITAGRPGDRLPSVRELMSRHHVSPVTVQRAIRELVAAGG